MKTITKLAYVLSERLSSFSTISYHENVVQDAVQTGIKFPVPIGKIKCLQKSKKKLIT